MDQFKQILAYLEELNLASVSLRLLLSILFAGIIGIEHLKAIKLSPLLSVSRDLVILLFLVQ